MKYFLSLLLFTSTLAAQTIGQYEIRKRTATGFTSYGVTLSNGQVIGQTAGVPAAITAVGDALTTNPLSQFAATTSAQFAGVISDETGAGAVVLANTPTLITPVLGVATATSINGTTIPASKTLVVTTDAGSVFQAYDADLSTYAGITPSANVQSFLGAANYAAMRTLLSLGTAALVNTGTTDGTVPVYDGSDQLSAAQFLASSGSEIGYLSYNGLTFADYSASGFDHAVLFITPTASRTHTFPDANGTVITTGNLTSITSVGTITSGTWQGTIIGPTYLGTGSSITTKFLRGDGTWQTISGGGDALVANPLSQFAATTSAQFAGVISDETGSGLVVLATSPTITTPTIAKLANLTSNGLVTTSGGDGTLSVDTTTKTRADAVEIGIAVSDETTALTTGTAKVTFRMPHAMTLTAVRASVTTAPTGSTLIVDINESGSTLMTTNKLSIDASEKTSTTAATAAGITDTALADDAEITIDLDQIGATIAGAGLKVWLIGTR